MKAISLIINNKVLVIVENEHKEVYINGVKLDFASYKEAIAWVKNGIY